MRTLTELVEEWLDVHHGKTWASYHNTIRKFLTFTCVDAIADIQNRHVRDWLDSLQEADTTKVKHLNILKAFFSYVTSFEKPPQTEAILTTQETSGFIRRPLFGQLQLYQTLALRGTAKANAS